MDGFPDHFQVYFEVAMRNTVAHGIDDCLGYFWVRSSKCGVVALDVVRCFADDFKITDYGILCF